MKTIVICLFFLASFFSVYENSFSFDFNVGERLKTRQNHFADNIRNQFFIEAKWFLLWRMWQENDMALTNAPPHFAGILLGEIDEDKERGKRMPPFLKRMLVSSLAGVSTLDFEHIGFMPEVEPESEIIQTEFLAPSIYARWKSVKAGIKTKINFGGDLLSLEDFPLQPIAFIQFTIGKATFQPGYNIFKNEARLRASYTDKDEEFFLRFNFKTPAENLRKASMSIDGTIKLFSAKGWKLYAGPAVVVNNWSFKESAGMVMIYGFQMP